MRARDRTTTEESSSTLSPMVVHSGLVNEVTNVNNQLNHASADAEYYRGGKVKRIAASLSRLTPVPSRRLLPRRVLCDSRNPSSTTAGALDFAVALR